MVGFLIKKQWNHNYYSIVAQIFLKKEVYILEKN